MSDRNSRLTARFLQVQNKLGVLGTQGMERLMRAVGDAYLEAPHDLATLSEDAGQRSKQSSLYTAGLFVQQHSLYNWIVRQNSVHGVAPGCKVPGSVRFGFDSAWPVAVPLPGEACCALPTKMVRRLDGYPSSARCLGCVWVIFPCRAPSQLMRSVPRPGWAVDGIHLQDCHAGA